MEASTTTTVDSAEAPRPETTPTTETTPTAPETAAAPSTRSESKEPPKMLDLVFCMDCTGSMGSYIQSAKQNIESIVQKLIAYEKCDLRFGLVAYRDHPPQDSSFITQVYPFVASLRRMKENLEQLSANGGGDGPEAVATGLYDSLHMPWRKDATKVVVLISDAPPHGLGENGDGFPQGEPNGHDPIAIAHEMAREGITVYSVGCEPAIQSYRYARAFLCSMAEITSGQAVALSNSQLLADVILGGAVEELGLARLMEQVQQEMHTYAADMDARGEAYAEEDVARHVTGVMSERGVHTMQMQTNAYMSDVFSPHLSAAPTLGAARDALGVYPAPAPASIGFPGAYPPAMPAGVTSAFITPYSSAPPTLYSPDPFAGVPPPHASEFAAPMSYPSSAPTAGSMGSLDLFAAPPTPYSSVPMPTPYVSSPPTADLLMLTSAPSSTAYGMPMSPVMPASAPAPRTEPEAVDLASAPISYAQVQRMVHKVNIRHV